MYHVICNPASGGGMGLEKLKAVKTFADANAMSLSIHMTNEKGAAARIARELTLDGAEKIIIIGGDGTISEVLNGLKDPCEVTLGIISAGSGNDFVRGMGLPTDVTEAMMAIKNGQAQCVDIGKVRYGKCKERLFGISTGLGFDALVCYRVDNSRLKKVLNKIGLGKLCYEIICVATLVTMKTCKAAIRVNDSEVINLHRFIFGAGLNTAFEGGGVNMAPNANLSDGKLDSCIGFDLSALGALKVFPELIAGMHLSHENFICKKFETLDIKLNKPMCLHADGEHLGFVKRVRISVIEGGIKIYGKG